MTPAQLGTAALLALALAACNSERSAPSGGGDGAAPDATSLDGRGSSGATSDAGSALDGAAGAPRDAGGPEDAGPAFAVTMVGDELRLRQTAGPASYYETCTGTPALVKRLADGGAEPPRDDRYPSYDSPGYYLDGVYRGPSFNLGCDVLACVPVPTDGGLSAGAAREWVQTGTQPIPADLDAGTNDFFPEPEDPARVVETRPLSGPVRLTLVYYTDDRCQGSPAQVSLDYEVPVEGVCCPMGELGCARAPIARGGWAPALDACPEVRASEGSFEAFYGPAEDVRGCAIALVERSCCACP